MGVVNLQITSTGDLSTDEANLTAIKDAGEAEDLIDVELIMGNDAGFLVNPNFNVKFGNLKAFSGGEDEVNPRHFRIRNGQTARTKTNFGKQLFNIENIGVDHDFMIEGIHSDGWKVRPGHFLNMRHCTIRDCNFTGDSLIGKGGANKTYVSQADPDQSQGESEAWGLKIGCYKAEIGPHGEVLVEDNTIDLHSGEYSGSGAENLQGKAIQIMVCPDTQKVLVRNNDIEHCSHRGIHLVDLRSYIEIVGNRIKMNAPYLHKGVPNGEYDPGYHGFGIASATGIGIVNGFRFQNGPIDLGEYRIEDNKVFCDGEDKVACQVTGIRRSDVGPIVFNGNSFHLQSESGSPLAAILWHGIDRAFFSSGNKLSGGAQIGMLVGANRAEWEFGTINARFSHIDVSKFVAEHGIMAYFGADTKRCRIDGSFEENETVMFPVDANQIPLLNGTTPSRYNFVQGLPPEDLQTVLDNLILHGVGFN